MKNKTANDYYKNHLKPPKAFFEWCYQNMRTYVWENKQQKIVASHRKHNEVIKKRLMKTSNLNFFDKADYFEVILSTSKRIERQIYEVYSIIENGEQQFEVHLVNLHLFSTNSYIKIKRVNSERYEWGLRPILNGMWRYDTPIYQNNWRERLERVSELKCLSLEGITSDCLPHYYKYRDRIEFIQKINAYKLEEEFRYCSLDFRRLTMNKLRKWKTFFRNSTYKLSDLELKLALERHGAKFICGSEKYLSSKDIDTLDSRIPLVKLQNYLIKEKRSFHYYNDYLSLLNDLGYSLNKQTLFPKNLRMAHDKLVDTLNAMKREIENKAFENRYSTLKKLEMIVNDLCFVVPRTANNLIDEGKLLHHCVGGSTYIKNHASGESTIVFVRKKDSPKEPYYTLELSHAKIRQLYGFKNKRATEDIQEAVNQWLGIISKADRKEKRVA